MLEVTYPIQLIEYYRVLANGAVILIASALTANSDNCPWLAKETLTPISDQGITEELNVIKDSEGQIVYIHRTHSFVKIESEMSPEWLIKAMQCVPL